MTAKSNSGLKKQTHSPPETDSAYTAFLLQDADVTYASSPINRVLTMMGLYSMSPKNSPSGDHHLIQLIRKGIRRKVLDAVMKHTGLTSDDIARVLHISPRTLRRHTPQTLLNEEQTERIIELVTLYLRGEIVFGDTQRFNAWMQSPNLSLGHQSPKTLLDTSIGIRVLLDILGRIEHGIPG